MVKVEFFVIETDRPEGIYKTGEDVTGRLVMKINERFKIDSVKLTFNGMANVYWTKKSADEIHTNTYSAHEDYVRSILVFINKENQDDLYLEVGDYSFTFSFSLPNTLPTSFEHNDGHIRYTLTAKIEIPWTLDKQVTKKLTIINDCNSSENNDISAVPYSVHYNKTMCCLFCQSDQIGTTLTVAKNELIEGENINFNVIIENSSSKKLKKVIVNLEQVVKLHASSKTRTCKKTIASKAFTGVVQERSLQEWSSSLLIPSGCPLSNNKCKIINISYYLQLYVNPSLVSRSYILNIPIFVGARLMRQDPFRPNELPSYDEYVRSRSTSFVQHALENLNNNEELDSAPSYPYNTNLASVPQNEL